MEKNIIIVTFIITTILLIVSIKKKNKKETLKEESNKKEEVIIKEKKKIIIIENDLYDRKIIEKILEKENINIFIVETIEDLEEVLKRHFISIILSSGNINIDSIFKITNKEDKKIPVLKVFNKNQTTKDQLLMEGYRDGITKPVSDVEIISKLNIFTN